MSKKEQIKFYTSLLKENEILLLKSQDSFFKNHYIGSPLNVLTNFSGTEGEAIIDHNGKIKIFVDTRYHLLVDKQAYKDVEVYCCTFLPDLKRFSSIENANGVELSDYNDAITEIAENMGAKIIDLNTDINISASNITQYTVDRLHPNSKGMELIADIIINAIEK